MRYTIKGITDRTITFNSLGITVRGNSNNFSQYPHSIARSIDIKTEDQWNEINAIVKAGLVIIEPEAEAKPSKPAKKSKSTKAPKIVKSKAAKTAKQIKGEKTLKIVRRMHKPSDDIPANTDVVVMTASGLAANGKMVKGSDSDFQESELTQASVDAAQKMDDEAKIVPVPIDESKLDISERMGNEVVISGVSKKSGKVKMTRSALPPVTTNWIDLEKTLNDNDDASHAFIDKKEDDGKDERFIE